MQTFSVSKSAHNTNNTAKAATSVARFKNEAEARAAMQKYLAKAKNAACRYVVQLLAHDDGRTVVLDRRVIGCLATQ